MKEVDGVIERIKLINMGAIEKISSNRKVYFENSLGEMLAKECGKCHEIMTTTSFYKGPNGLGGRGSNCKACTSNVLREKYSKDPEKYLEQARKSRKNNVENLRNRKRRYRENHPEQVRESQRKLRKSNKMKYIICDIRRRARKALLPDTFTLEQQSDISSYFSGGCALTGSTDYHMDHVIPLSIGHGGTTYENMIPLRGDLNLSKNASHIFEWFDWAKGTYDLSQAKFDALISYLAEVNEMTTKEYRMYVNWCFDNPRDINEIDNGKEAM